VGSASERTWTILQRKYGIDRFFFPGLDLNRLPNGPLTEIDAAKQILDEHGIPVTVENIYHFLELKRESFRFLGATGHRIKLKSARVGAVFPVSFELATEVANAVLYLFAAGFAAKLGADAYDYLKQKLKRRFRGATSSDVRIVIEVTSDFLEANGDIALRVGRIGEMKKSLKRAKPKAIRRRGD
jgi:hypothetical protein